MKAGSVRVAGLGDRDAVFVVLHARGDKLKVLFLHDGWDTWEVGSTFTFDERGALMVQSKDLRRVK